MFSSRTPNSEEQQSAATSSSYGKAASVWLCYSKLAVHRTAIHLENEGRFIFQVGFPSFCVSQFLGVPPIHLSRKRVIHNKAWYIGRCLSLQVSIPSFVILKSNAKSKTVWIAVEIPGGNIYILLVQLSLPNGALGLQGFAPNPRCESLKLSIKAN